MNKKSVMLIVTVWGFSAACLMAQEVHSKALEGHVGESTQTTAGQQNQEEDNSDFAFTESQLDEDLDASQAVSVIVSSNNDPYASEVGYLFSPMRFKVRGYDNMYNQTYMNGLGYFGAGLEYAYDTIFGPLKANIHWSNMTNKVGFYISAGYNF